jgi:bacteriorhodopsin
MAILGYYWLALVYYPKPPSYDRLYQVLLVTVSYVRCLLYMQML